MITSDGPAAGSPTVAEGIVAAARDMATERDPAARVEGAIAAAVGLIRPVDYASITLLHRDRRKRNTLETPAATSSVGLLLDEMQYELEEGPCLQAIVDAEIVYSPDIDADERWPRWGPRAASETAVRSALGVRLFTHSDVIGALNLHSETRDAFDDADIADATAVAAHIALAVSAATRIDNLEKALDSRTLTGQATGFVMARYDLDADAAFGVLTRLSSHQNRRLTAVAADVVRDRRLPDGSDPTA